MNKKNLLDQVVYQRDLRKLNKKDLKQLSKELKEELDAEFEEAFN